MDNTEKDLESLENITKSRDLFFKEINIDIFIQIIEKNFFYF